MTSRRPLSTNEISHRSKRPAPLVRLSEILRRVGEEQIRGEIGGENVFLLGSVHKFEQDLCLLFLVL